MNAIVKAAPRPPVPIQYENACKALALCTKINDAWQWSDKADALAAWAKIYADDTIAREARLLKLHAFRRMGQLAREISAAKPVKTLREEGLRASQAQEAVAIGDLTDKKFDGFTKRDHVPTPGTIVGIELKDCPGWERMQRALSVAWAIAGHNSPQSLAKKMSDKQKHRARLLMLHLREWMREFDQALGDE